MANEIDLPYAFGPFVVDRVQRQLLRDGQRIALQPKAFDLLLLLIEKRGVVVPKEELLELLWPDTFVEEANLAQTVYVLRKALGQDAMGEEYISTLPKRGYRFNAPFDKRVTKSRKHRARVFLAIGIVIVTIALIAAFLRRRQPAPGAAFSAATVRLSKLTRTGDITNAAISPDGQSIAYVVDANGARSVWLKHLNGPVTRLLAAEEVRYSGLTFSRDGQSILLVRFPTSAPLSTSPHVAAAGGTLFRMAVRGGAATIINDYVSSPVDPSPDGTHIAFVRGSPTSPTTELVVANADGSSERVVAARHRPAFLSNTGPAWSPGGAEIAVAATPNGADHPLRVVAVDIQTSAERSFSSSDWFTIGRVTWPVPNTVLFIGSAAESQPRQVWRLSRGARPERITNDFNNYSQLSVTRDGLWAITIQSERTSTLWTMEPGDEQSVRQLTRGGSSIDGLLGLAIADPNHIVYTSLGSDRLNLWRIERSGSAPAQVTEDSSFDRNPTASPDGHDVVYESNRGGSFHLWRVRDSGKATQLTSGAGEFAPRFSPDGKWLFYSTLTGGRMVLSKMPAAGGKPTIVADVSGMGPVPSPDGRFVAFQIRGETSEARPQIGIVATDTPSAMRVLTLSPTAFQLGSLILRWTPDGRGIAFIDHRGGVSNIVVQMLDGGAPKSLTHFNSDRIFFFDWSPDGTWLALSRGTITSDVVLISAASASTDPVSLQQR